MIITTADLYIKSASLPDPKQPSRLPQKQQAAGVFHSTKAVPKPIENRILDEPLRALSPLLQKLR